MGTVSDTVAAEREFVVDAVAWAAHMTADTERQERENAAGSVAGQIRGKEMVRPVKRELEERGH